MLTVNQLVRHYGSPTAASRKTGYTLQTLRNWRRLGAVPKRAEGYIRMIEPAIAPKRERKRV